MFGALLHFVESLMTGNPAEGESLLVDAPEGARCLASPSADSTNSDASPAFLRPFCLALDASAGTGTSWPLCEVAPSRDGSTRAEAVAG